MARLILIQHLNNPSADIGTCRINVTDTSIQLAEVETHQISYTTANNDVIVFTSSDTDIVTVSDSGLVIAIAECKYSEPTFKCSTYKKR